MADTAPTRHEVRAFWLVVVGAMLATACLTVQAQPCSGPLAAPSAAAATPSTEKFRLIAQQCTVLSEPAKVQRAAQLDLYQGSASVGVSMPADAAARPAAAAASAPAASAPGLTQPPSRDAARVLTLAPVLTEAARLNQIDPLLLHAIAHVESRHNTQAISPAGARGAMQVMPATARRFGVTDPERSLLDADTNVRASAALLRTLRSRYGDDLRLVLAAYNAGEGAVEKYGRDVPPYPETQAYVRNVLAVYRRLSAEFAVSESGALVARGGQS
jgi:soluble lytic murein transglycosylase-like protein